MWGIQYLYFTNGVPTRGIQLLYFTIGAQRGASSFRLLQRLSFVQFCSTRSTPARSHWRRQAGYGWPAQDPQFQNAQQNVNSNSPQGVDIRSEYAYHNSPNRPVQEFSQNENGFLLPSRPQPHHNGALHMSPSTNQVPDRQTTFEGTSQHRINSAVQHSNTGRNTETRCSGHVNDHINKVAESVQNSRASRQTNFRNSGSIVEQDIPPLWLTRSVDDCSPERNIAQRQAEKVPTSIQTEQQQRTPSFPPRSRLPTHDRQHESHRSRNNSQAQNNCSESSNHRIEQSTRAVPSNLSQDPPRLDEGIIFPDSKQFIPNVANGEPSCANGTTFCVDLDNYPSAHLKKILKKEAKVYKELFGNDVFSDQLDPIEDIKMRFGEEQELCRYREEVVFPKVGMTKDKRWMFIANTEEIKQGVRVEICEKPDNPCSMTQGFPIGYVTSCRQKYVIRKMLSLEGDGSPTQDDFWFPSCCACHVVLSTEVESRMLSSGGPKLGK